MCAVARVDRFSLTHRPSVAPLKEAVRESGPQFGDNLLNDYSGVRWITLIATAHSCRHPRRRMTQYAVPLGTQCMAVITGIPAFAGMTAVRIA
jgi:hypothetical protein